jgi:trehalose 6-phosphate synthase/phosphatase
MRRRSPPCAGVNPARLLSGFAWSDTIWRQGELAAQFKGKTVLLGVDDMDVFKGIELKLQVGGET